MTDVARAAGVSAQTVSRVLRQPESVAAPTRERVLEAIRATGYVQNQAASHLASNRSRTVAAILPVISASVFSDTMHAASTVLAPHGYQLQLGYTDYRPEREERLVRSFLGWRPDGFFIVGALHTPAVVDLLKSSGVPVVETWGWNENPIDLLVGFSNRNAVADLVRRLVAKGHRRLVFAGVVSPGDDRAAERLAGFTETVTELLPDEPLRVLDLPGRPVAMQTGVEMLEQIRTEYREATAAVFSSDVFASGAVLAGRRLGVRIPEDLAVCGFGDFEVSRLLDPALTTVAIDGRAIGSVGAEMLLARMRSEPVEKDHVDVGYEIIMRDSA